MKNKKLLIVLTIGVAVLLVVAFVLGPALFAPKRPVQPTPAPMQTNTSTFRQDGILHFQTPTGAARASIAIEIAATEETRTQGLMGRTQLAPDQGMLFIFDESEPRAFWMANTPLPLDIIFVGTDKHIVSIQENAKPFSEESLPSEGSAQYVVEVNAGFCGRNGIVAGDAIQWLQK
jgi:uncharacterized protein